MFPLKSAILFLFSVIVLLFIEENAALSVRTTEGELFVFDVPRQPECVLEEEKNTEWMYSISVKFPSGNYQPCPLMKYRLLKQNHSTKLSADNRCETYKASLYVAFTKDNEEVVGCVRKAIAPGYENF